MLPSLPNRHSLSSSRKSRQSNTLASMESWLANGSSTPAIRTPSSRMAPNSKRMLLSSSRTRCMPARLSLPILQWLHWICRSCWTFHREAFPYSPTSTPRLSATSSAHTRSRPMKLASTSQLLEPSRHTPVMFPRTLESSRVPTN